MRALKLSQITLSDAEIVKTLQERPKSELNCGTVEAARIASPLVAFVSISATVQ